MTDGGIHPSPCPPPSRGGGIAWAASCPRNQTFFRPESLRPPELFRTERPLQYRAEPPMRAHPRPSAVPFPSFGVVCVYAAAVLLDAPSDRLRRENPARSGAPPSLPPRPPTIWPAPGRRARPCAFPSSLHNRVSAGAAGGLCYSFDYGLNVAHVFPPPSLRSVLSAAATGPRVFHCTPGAGVDRENTPTPECPW